MNRQDFYQIVKILLGVITYLTFLYVGFRIIFWLEIIAISV